MLNPIFIFNFIWIIVLLLTLSFEKILGPVSNLLILIIITGCIVFSTAGILITKLKIKEQKKFFNEEKVFKILKCINFLQILIIIGIFFKIREIPLNQYWLVSLRYKIIYEGFSYGIIEYLMLLMINFSIYLYVLYVNKIIENKIVYLYIYLGLTYVLLLTNRLNLVFYLINLFVIYSLKNKIKIKSILILLISSFGIFYFIGKITNKMSNLKNVMLSYFLMGLKNFDYILNSDYKLEYGKFSFQFFEKILIKLKLIPSRVIVNNISEENGYFIISESLLTNVPTMYGRLIKDFGVLYIFFIVFILGIISMLIYKRALKQDTLFIYVYSFISGILLFSFYDEMILRVVSYWIQTFVAGIIFENICYKNIKD